MTTTNQRALVVYESMFGNTAEIARSVVGGLELGGLTVTLVDVLSAPEQLPDVDLVVIGAPTHAFSLSRPRTRADAVRQGASADRQATGVREWLGSLRVPAREGAGVVATFDTRVTKVRRLPKAAGPSAARLARRRGLTTLTKSTSYLVDDIGGPLVAGEAERAAAWGRSLAEMIGIRAAARDAHAASDQG